MIKDKVKNMVEDSYELMENKRFEKRMKRKYEALMNSPIIPKENKKLVEDFFYAEIHSISYNRMYKYLNTLKEFFEIVGKNHNEIERKDISIYLTKLELERHNRSQTIQKKLKDLKSFFRRVNDGELPKFLRITYKLKPDLRKPIIVDKKDIRKIIQVLNDNLRDQVFVVLSYEGALRANEVLRTRIENVREFEENHQRYFEILTYNSKSDSPYKDKEKIVLVKEYYVYLKLYMDKLKKDFGEDVQGYLFYNPDKGIHYPLTYAYVQRVMRKIRKRLNMWDLDHHDFRRSRVTHLMDMGFTEQEVKKYAGWSERSNMTMVYEKRDYEGIKKKLLKV